MQFAVWQELRLASGNDILCHCTIEKGRKIYHYYSLGIMIPINAIIIPFILIFRKIGILNTRIGIILAFIVTNLAFSILS